MRPTRVVVGVALAACGVAALSGVAVTRVLSSNPKDTLPSDKPAALQTVSGATLPSGKAAALEKVFDAPQGNVPTMRGTSGLPMPGLLKHWEIRPRPLDALIDKLQAVPLVDLSAGSQGLGALARQQTRERVRRCVHA